MTTDELRRMLELAARACGAQIEPCVCSSQPFRFKATGGHWSPHADDGASARMRTALRDADLVLMRAADEITQTREALRRVHRWCLTAYDAGVAAGVRRWIEGGMIGKLPPMPKWILECYPEERASTRQWEAEMGNVTCPRCKGSKEGLVFENRGPDSSTHTHGIRPCGTCHGSGEITEQHAERIRVGRAAFERRVDRGELMSDAARRIGIPVTALSAYEHGVQVSDEVMAALAKAGAV